MSKRVLSFSLWGDNPIYNIGAIKNAYLAKHFYPDFECWYYVHIDSVPRTTIEALQDLHYVKIIIKYGDLNSCKPMTWRYEAIDDPSVEIMMPRDTDTRILYREKLSVDVWLSSGKLFHIMRDHPHHTFPIMGGMFGTKKIPGVNWKERLALVSQKNKFCDQDFLAEHIYPFIYDNACIHANFFKIEGRENVFSISYNHQIHFIGEYVYEDDTYSEYHNNELKQMLKKTEFGYNIAKFTENLPIINTQKIILDPPKIINKIHIITTLVISKTGSPHDQERNTELKTALIKNIESEYVEKIHLFVDDIDAELHLLQIVSGNPKIHIISVGKQPTYYDFFNYILNNLPNNICMITNSDIYLHSIVPDLIDRLKKDQFVYALTRYEEDMSSPFIDNITESFDCYIFNSVYLKRNILHEDINYYQNHLGIETRIITAFFNNAFCPLNPCYQIKIVHQHRSGLRNYKEPLYLNKILHNKDINPAFTYLSPNILL
jgi:hypothetical protein